MAQAVTTLPLKRTARRGDWWQLLLLWLLIPVLLVVAGIAWFEWSYTDRVFPGVQALGVDLSGMTEAEARTALEAVAAMAQLTLSLRPDALPLEDYVLDKHYQRKHGPSAYYGQDAQKH